MSKEFIPWACPDITEEEVNAVTESVKSTWIGGNGPLVKEFEKKVAQKIGVKHALAVNNGTSALLCSLQALRRLNDNLMAVVPTFTFIATVNTAYEICGKEFMYMRDCDLRTWNMTTKSIKPIWGGTNLIIPVDVAGLPVDYNKFNRLKIPILADSAEAFGARYKGKLVGSQAFAHIFSLHSAKTISTGEGGLITTNDDEFYNLIKSLTNQGYGGEKEPWEYKHPNIGFNYRMAEPQAALGLVQLKKLHKYVSERISNSKIYKGILGDLVDYQKIPSNCIHPYFIFGILIKNDNQIPFCKEMYKNNIQVKVTWKPAHLQSCYNHINKIGHYTFVNAENIANRIVSLPIWNGIGEEKVKYIAEVAKNVLRKLNDRD